MAFPAAAEELALHERVLASDPVAPVDVFQGLMDPLAEALRRDLPCTEDEAHDSGVDAVLAYLEEPGRYDRNRGRLSTYLMDIAKKRAIDRLRSRSAAVRRDDTYAAAVELRGPNPKDIMEAEVEAQELWQRVEEAVPSERDRRVVKLILAGERSTAALAEALDISGLSPLEQRREVKQHRDRLLKVLERLGSRLGDDRNA
ncbi:MAG: sigma-70 family RNA polymerase sigma factor [Deltaproteobacteria bacterium]|nr:sigma-70 family RNA polymerase sigma factor [Deltaproteobacteria bacterium]